MTEDKDSPYCPVGRSIFGTIVLLTVCIIIIQGAPSSTTEPFVCGNADYRMWHVPCGTACTPVKDYGMQKATATTKINKILRQIIRNMKEAQAMIKDLKVNYSIDRIRNIEKVNSIENETEYKFINGNIDFKNDERKFNSLNVMEITKADYNSMVAAIMFTDQMRFYESSSKVYGQLSNNLRRLSVKLATILCDFEIIQCISGNVPTTNLTCQSTVAEYIRSSEVEETRMLYEYRVLRDIEKLLAVLIPKYKLI